MGKRKLIKIITVRGVLSNRETLGPELKAGKPGINGMGTREAIATNQVLSYSGSVCYSSEIRKLPHMGKKKSLPFPTAFWRSCLSHAPCSWWPPLAHPCPMVFSYRYVQERKHGLISSVSVETCVFPSSCWARHPRGWIEIAEQSGVGLGGSQQNNIYFHKWCYSYEYETQNLLLAEVMQ